MTHCFNPRSTVPSDALPIVDSLIDKFTSAKDRDGVHPLYFNLFRNLNESTSDYLKVNEDGNNMFKYRASIFIIDWFNDHYRHGGDQIPVEDIYKDLIENLGVKTLSSNIKHINGLPTNMIPSIVKSLGKVVANNIDTIQYAFEDGKANTRGYSIRDAIVEFYTELVDELSTGSRTPYKDIITNAVIENLKSPDGVVYRKLAAFLSKEYNIDITGRKIDSSLTDTTDSEFEGDDTSSGVPSTFGYSDNYGRNVVVDGMDAAFKQQLSGLVQATSGNTSNSYIPTYMTVSQIVTSLVNLHRNDTTLANFKETISNAALSNKAYSGLNNIFNSTQESDILFTQRYVALFSKSGLNTNHIVITSSKSTKEVSRKTLNAASRSEEVGYSNLRAAMNVLGNIEFLKTINIRSVTDTTVRDVLIALKLVPNNIDIPYGTYPQGVIDSITHMIRYANNYDANTPEKDTLHMLGRTTPLLKYMNDHNMIPTKLTYMNEIGKTVYTPTDEFYMSRFTKSLVRYPIRQNGKLIKGDIDMSKMWDTFRDIINDPTLAEHPLLFRSKFLPYSNALFTHSDTGPVLTNNDTSALLKLLNLKRETGFSLVNSKGVKQVYPYTKLYGTKAHMVNIINMMQGVYTIPTSDSTSSYSIDIPTNANMTEIRDVLIGLVNHDKVVYMYGVNLNQNGASQNVNKWGVDKDGNPTGEGFKFKETMYDIQANDSQYSVVSYVTYLINLYANDPFTPINSEKDLYDIAVNNKAAFERLFDRAHIQPYIDGFINYQYAASNSKFNAMYDSAGLTAKDIISPNASESEFKNDMFRAYLNEFTYSSLINNMFTGSPAEYRNATTMNKRLNQAVRKTKSTVSTFNDDHKIIIAKDIQLQSPVLEALMDKTPNLIHVRNSHNATDGISYITDVAMINILKNRGTYEIYSRVIEDLQNGKLVNPKDHKGLMEQLKTFAYARRPQSSFIRNNANDESLTSYQFKDSSVVLFRSQIEGTEFEKLYDIMVNSDIHQLSFESALKVGYAPKINIANADGTLNTNSLKSIIDDGKLDDHVIHIKHSDLGVQQEVVSHILDKHTVQASQFIKKIISDLNPNNNVYKLNGNLVTGKEIFNTIEDILSTQIQKDFDAIMYELGVLDARGDLQFISSNTSITGKFKVDINKFKTAIKDIADKNDLSANVQQMIDSNINEGDLVLSLPIIYNTFENLLIGRINKQILRRELPGAHVTIVPDIFRDAIESRPNGSKNTAIDQNKSHAKITGVQYTTAFLKDVSDNRKGSYRLREEHSYDKNGQLINYAEIVINPFTSDVYKHCIKTRINTIDGKPVREKYIDMDMISDASLEMIALRIPTDSKASMVMFKVVGFTTDGASKAIVPTALVNRTGWDFDIDTIYTYVKHSKLVNSTIVPITRSNQFEDKIDGNFTAYMDRLDPQWKESICESLFTPSNADVFNPMIKGLYKFIGALPSSDRIIASYEIIREEMEYKMMTIHIGKSEIMKDINDRYNKLQYQFEDLMRHVNNVRTMGADVRNWADSKIRTSNNISASVSEEDVKKTKSNIMHLLTAIKDLQDSQSKIDTSLKKLNDNSEYRNITKYKDYSNDVGVRVNYDVFESLIDYHLIDVDSTNAFKVKHGVAVHEQVNRSGLRAKFNASSESYKDSNEVLDNRLFDAYKAVLTSDQHVVERNRSNNSDDIMASSKIISAYSATPPLVNFNDPFTRSHFQQENMSIGTLKGISVNIDGVVAVFQSVNAKLKQPIVRKLTSNELPKINVDGKMVPIKIDDKVATKYFGEGNYILNTREDGSFKSIIIKSYSIGNNHEGTKTTIIESPITDHISEATPAIFDAVNKPFGANINEKTINLFRILAMSPVIEWNNKSNSYWIYAMAIVNHPDVIAWTNDAVRLNKSLSTIVSKFIIDAETTIDDTDVMSTSEVLKSYDPSKTVRDSKIRLATVVQNALTVAKDLSDVGFTIKTEKKIQGAYSTLYREHGIFKSMLDVDKLSIKTIQDAYVNGHDTDSIFKSYRSYVADLDNTSLQNMKSVFEYTYKEVYDQLLRITSVDQITDFIDNNPTLSELLGAGVVMPDGSSFIKALYPSIFNIDTPSVIPYIEANYKYGHATFGRLYSDIFVQHGTEFNDIIKIISAKSNIPLNETSFKQLRDSLTNYLIHNAIIDDNRFESLNLPVEAKERVLGLKNTRAEAVEVFLELNDIKKQVVSNYGNMSTVTKYPPTLIEAFRELSTKHKINIVTSIFDNLVDSDHFMHPMNMSIETSNGSDYIRYSVENSDSINDHTMSFEESLSSDNPFMADTARDIVLHNIMLNGFKFGLNVGKIIPINFFYNTYSNNYGHPVECVNNLSKVKIEMDHSIISSFEDAYYRQNAGSKFVPTIYSNDKAFTTNKYVHGVTIYRGGASTNIPISIVSPKHQFKHSRRTYAANHVNIKGITYKRYTMAELANKAVSMKTSQGETATIPADVKSAILGNLEFANAYVYIPVNKLLSSEYGEYSVMPTNNMYISDGTTSNISSDARMANAILNGGTVQYTSSIVNGQSIETPSKISIVDSVNRVLSQLVEDTSLDVEGESIGSTMEDMDVQFVVDNDGFQDATSLAIEASNTEDSAYGIEDTTTRLVSASLKALDLIDTANIQLKRYGDVSPEMNNAITAIRKTRYKKSRLDTADYAYGNITAIVDYYNVILSEIPVLSDEIAKMARNPALFEHNDTAEFLAYSRLLNRASLFIKIIKQIDSLDTQGISDMGRGYVKDEIGGFEHVIITDDVRFESVRDIFSNVPADRIITNFEEYNAAKLKGYKEYLEDLIYNNPNEPLYSINTLGVRYLVDKASIQTIIDNIDNSNFSFVYYTDKSGKERIYENNAVHMNITELYLAILNDDGENIYGDVVTKIDSVKRTFTEYSKYIGFIEYNRDRYAGNVVQMQSRLSGTLHKLVVNDILDRGFEPTDAEIAISYRDLTNAVDEYYRTNDFNVTNVNLGMRWFGTPFISTNVDIDNISRQFFILRSNNRDYHNSMLNEYNALIEKYDVNPDDASLFKDGKLLNEFDYDRIETNKNEFYSQLTYIIETRYKSNNYKEGNALRRGALLNLLINTYDISESMASLLEHHLVLIRRNNKDVVDANAIVASLAEKVKLEHGEFLTEREYNERRIAIGFDNAQYINVGSIFNLQSDQKIVVRLDYNAQLKSDEYARLPQSKQLFLNDLQVIFEKTIKNSDKYAIYDKGAVMFLKKDTIKGSVKSFFGVKPISNTGVWYDVDGNLHFKAHVKDIFNVGQYPKFILNDDIAYEQDFDSERYAIDYFKKWYSELGKSQQAMDTINVEDITLEFIDNYNTVVDTKNKEYQLANQDYNVSRIMSVFLERAESVKTANDMDVIYNASNLRNSVTSANDRHMIDKVLTNLYNQSTIKSKYDQAINVAMRVSSISFMWLNYLSGAKNVILGTLHMIEEASKNGEFAMQHFREGTGSFMTQIIKNANHLKENPDGNITVAIFNFFDAHYEDTRDISVDENGVSTILNWADKIGYMPNQMGETMMQYSMVFANARSHRIFNGKIYSFNELARHMYEAKLIDMLSLEHKHEFKAFQAYMHDKRKKSKSYQSTINNDIWTFVRTKAMNNRLSKDQVERFKSIQKEVEVLKTDFEKLPSVYDSLEANENHKVGFKLQNGKPVVSDKEMALFMRKIGTINQTMHGIYNTIDRNSLQDSVTGNLMFQFRKWMYPTYSRYFGRHFMKDSPIEVSHLIETPIFKPVWDLLKTAFNPTDMTAATDGTKLGATDISEGIKNVLYNFYNTVRHLKRYYNYLPMNEKAAMNRALKQMTIFTVLSTATALLVGGLKDRDDREKNMWLHTMTYIMNGVFNEWSATVPVYGWYTEIAQTREKLFVSEDVFKNLEKVIRYSILEMYYDKNDPRARTLKYRSGSRKGQSKAKIALYKLIPVLKQIEKQRNVESYQKFYSMSNPFIHD